MQAMASAEDAVEQSSSPMLTFQLAQVHSNIQALATPCEG